METQKLRKIWLQVPNNYYESGIESNFLQRHWHKRKWEVVEKLVSGTSGRILDVGCASGHISNKIQKKLTRSRVVGLDVSLRFIEFAKKRYPKVKFVLADAHSLPFSNKTFDLILSTETLEHVVFPQKVLREMRRVLKPDGVIVVSMDSGNSLFRLVWYFWTRWGPGKVWLGSHLTHFNSTKLADLITKAGFEIVEKHTATLGMAVYYKCKKR